MSSSSDLGLAPVLERDSRSGGSVHRLHVRGLRARYGHAEVLHGVDIDVVPGGITVVQGASGAGKTTLLRSICGTVARDGVVALGDVRLDRMHAEAIARHGVVQAPEARGTVPNRLAIAHALTSSPRILLMDEPSSGLAPRMAAELCAALRAIVRIERIGMLLVEQDALLSREVADRVYVLEEGRTTLADIGYEPRRRGS
jgi:branched-chain amino acid transport system ATP-binding protein